MIYIIFVHAIPYFKVLQYFTIWNGFTIQWQLINFYQVSAIETSFYIICCLIINKSRAVLKKLFRLRSRLISIRLFVYLNINRNNYFDGLVFSHINIMCLSRFIQLFIMASVMCLGQQSFTNFQVIKVLN